MGLNSQLESFMSYDTELPLKFAMSTVCFHIPNDMKFKVPGVMGCVNSYMKQFE